MERKEWILVTGASTGIGRACAEALAAAGFGVYAGARGKSDLAELAAIPGVAAVKLDVTRQADVDAAVKLIRKRGTGLRGLVNNAGIAVAGPLLDIGDEEMMRQFDVNFFGIHRVTRALLPMIMKSRGRIVMISSDSGFFATPFFGPYCASKFALEGYSDSLRREMLLCGVGVVVVQPGRVATPIWDKGEKLLDLFGDSPFAVPARKIGEYAVRKGRSDGLPPAAVARVVLGALTAKKPRSRYMVARNAMKYRLVKVLPDRAVDRMIAKELGAE